MTNFTFNTDYIQVLVDSDEITSEIENNISKMLNSKYFLKIDTNIYSSEGLLFENPSITTDDTNNTITVISGIYTIIIKDVNYMLEGTNFDKNTIQNVYELYNKIFDIKYKIETSLYTFDPSTEKITFTALGNKEYIMPFDLSYFIYDMVNYQLANGASDGITSNKNIIKNEIETVYSLKRHLETLVGELTTLYIEVNQLNF